MLVLRYLRIARSLACVQDDLRSLDESLRARGASYHVLKDVELQGTDMDWGCLRLWHSMFLLRIAFSLILSYPTLLRYFREAVLALLAHAILVVLRHKANAQEKKREATREPSP